MNKIAKQYCANCVLPRTRPNINFDLDGRNCNCIFSSKNKNIDWTLREKQFRKIVNKIKGKNKAYDCIIPVSGGKDSTWQVIKALEYDLKILAVTWKTPVRTELGQKNLENLIRLGVDHYDISVNPNTEKLFTKKTFIKMGSPVIPMHMALHAIPVNLARKLDIPLIIWGENSAFEYGSDIDELKEFTLTREWLMKYGVTNGTIAEDWVDEELSIKDLEIYRWPSESEQKEMDLSAIFLGHFFSWDPRRTFEIASQSGFESAKKPLTGLYEFADIDDEFLITIHHWIKWYKFGFTRLWDNLSIEIRNNRMSRQDAIKIIERIGNEEPTKEISEFCKYIGINLEEYFTIVEKFRNKDILKKNQGKWMIKNFLIDNWDW